MEEPKYESQFLQLVMGLQSSAWMLMGKIANPVSGKLEKNLEAAKATIDTLLMLKEKTKGNLSKAEQGLLESAIQQLQVNYVEEVNKPAEPEVKEKTSKDKVGAEKSEHKEERK